MPYRFFDSKIIAIIDETDDVKRFLFQIPELKQYDFLPGQFTLLDLPIQSKQTTRAYSIASYPNGTNTVELIVVHKKDGMGTDYLFNEAKIGTTVKLSAALGKFTFATAPTTEFCFICTGTGIAPFRSMLLNMLHTNTQQHKVTLLFGTRYEKDILYKTEMETLQNTLAGFQYIPVLSRETNPTWQGAKGYVHPIYQQLYAAKTPILFFLCGWKDMVIETAKNLEQMGYERNQIKFELYN